MSKVVSGLLYSKSNKTMKRGEKWLERELVNRIKAIGGKALKFSSMTEIGYPDRLILMPEGKVYWAEIKSEGKKLRVVQILRKRQLEALGFQVFIIDSEDSLTECITKLSILEG